jgi:hypothetical protein
MRTPYRDAINVKIPAGSRSNIAVYTQFISNQPRRYESLTPKPLIQKAVFAGFERTIVACVRYTPCVRDTND